jgi:hypothetical protein
VQSAALDRSSDFACCGAVSFVVAATMLEAGVFRRC